jgi:hypothetical protein
MTMVGVECTFDAEGHVRVRRVRRAGTWTAVEQGRQWVDGEGRHVLVMLPGQVAWELLLRSDTLTWEERPVGNPNLRMV